MRYILPETNSSHLKIGWAQKDMRKYSKHPFLDANLLLASGYPGTLQVNENMAMVHIHLDSHRRYESTQRVEIRDQLTS